MLFEYAFKRWNKERNGSTSSCITIIQSDLVLFDKFRSTNHDCPLKEVATQCRYYCDYRNLEMGRSVPPVHEVVQIRN